MTEAIDEIRRAVAVYPPLRVQDIPKISASGWQGLVQLWVEHCRTLLAELDERDAQLDEARVTLRAIAAIATQMMGSSLASDGLQQIEQDARRALGESSAADSTHPPAPDAAEQMRQACLACIDAERDAWSGSHPATNEWAHAVLRSLRRRIMALGASEK